MADKKISALTGASTPLAGTEVLPIVQSGATVKVAVSNLTAGRNVSMLTAAVGATLAGWSVFDKVTQSGAGSTANYNNEDNTLVGSNVYYGGSPANFRYISNGTATLLRQDGGNQYFLNAPAGVAGAVATLTETFRFDTNSNLIPKVAAKGINFTANTPAAGMTSQLLNWYEEGSVTVTATTSTSGTITLSGETLRYVRIGKTVVLNGLLIVSSVSSPVGYVKINGLPFSGGASTSSRCPISIVGEGLEVTMTTSLTASIQSGTIIYIFKNNGLGGQSNCAQDFKAGTNIFIGGTYITD